MSKLKAIEETGRQVWLAGLGVYGAGWKYTVEKFDTTFTKGNELINDLIATGETVETKIQEKIPTVKTIDLESRLDAIKQKLGLNKVSEATRIEELTAKVDSLTAAVAQLAKAESKPVRKSKTAPKAKVTAKKAAK